MDDRFLFELKIVDFYLHHSSVQNIHILIAFLIFLFRLLAEPRDRSSLLLALLLVLACECGLVATVSLEEGRHEIELVCIHD